MDSQEKSLCIIIGMALLAVTVVLSTVSITQHLTAEAAIKQGLVQGPFGRWVQPDRAEVVE